MRALLRLCVPVLAASVPVLAASALAAQATAAQGDVAATIVAIQVHGNHTTPDADVIGLAAVAVGQALTARTVEDIDARLRASGRFRAVDVRRRFASIADLSQIVIVIVVEEQEGISVAEPTPGPFHRLRASAMWMPVLSYEDGYGFTYGARVSFIELLGKRTRISSPLTWGGQRQAAVEVERTFERGPFTRVIGGVGVTRRENPAYDLGDLRVATTLRLERAFTPTLRVAANLGSASVDFGDTTDRLSLAGAEVTLDTRRDPTFPRDAIYASAGAERLWFDDAPDTLRLRADVRGYVALWRQNIIVVRALHTTARDRLPPFERALLGGAASLRGRRLGYRTGDRLAAGSAELRLPLSSPLRVGRVAFAVFVDSGTAYEDGQRLRDQRFDTSIGAGVSLAATVFHARLDVAHALGAGTRVVFGLGVVY